MIIRSDFIEDLGEFFMPRYLFHRLLSAASTIKEPE